MWSEEGEGECEGGEAPEADRVHGEYRAPQHANTVPQPQPQPHRTARQPLPSPPAAAASRTGPTARTCGHGCASKRAAPAAYERVRRMAAAAASAGVRALPEGAGPRVLAPLDPAPYPALAYPALGP